MATITKYVGVTTLRRSSPQSSASTTVATKEAITGEGVPGYRQKIRRHIDASSAYTRYSNSVEVTKPFMATCDQLFYNPIKPNDPPFLRKGTAGGYGWTTITAADSASGLTGYVPAGADSKALAKFNGKVIARSQQVQGLSVIGELHKTIEGLRHPAQAIRNGLASYLDLVTERGRRIARPRRVSLNVSAAASQAAARNSRTIDQRRRAVGSMIQSTWLEYTFGLKPTLMDLNDTVKAVAHYIDHDLPVPERVAGWFEWENVQAVAPVTISVGGGVNSTGADGAGGFGFTTADLQGVKTTMTSGRIRYSGAIKCTTPGFDTARSFGFTMPALLPSIWELIPWSWAIDYVSNVGDILAGLQVARGDLLYVNKAVRVEVSETHAVTKILPVNGVALKTVSSSLRPGSFTINSWYYSRFAYQGTFIPTFHFDLPNLKQAFNLASVITQSKGVSTLLGGLLSFGRRA